MDGVFEALPGAWMTCFPIPAGIGFQSGPVPPAVALVRAQLVAVAVGRFIISIGSAPISKRCNVVLPEIVAIGREILPMHCL
jgi:hypothetical protein